MAKRIRAARHYQRADNAVRRLSLQGRRTVARELKAALKHLGGAVVPSDNRITTLYRAGRWHEIRNEPRWDHFGEVLKKTFAKIADVYQEGAGLGVRKINGAFHQARRRVRYRKMGVPIDNGSEQWLSETFSQRWQIAKELAKAAADVFNFDMFDAATQASLRQAQDELIQQLTNDARDTIEAIIRNAALEGLGPEEIVSDIRAMIGLTSSQAQAVMNFRSMLEDLDSTALTRQLRNTAWDDVIQTAIDNDVSIADATIDQMVSDYADNYLDYRASTIAQTESVRAANEGLHDAYSQAVDRGALPADAVTREWELGDSPCPICESIPDNNPDGVGLDEDFDSDDGPVGDPPVHPNCMCSVNYITDISKVPEEDEESGAYDTNAPIEGVG